jgi:hypothetical protein
VVEKIAKVKSSKVRKAVIVGRVVRGYFDAVDRSEIIGIASLRQKRASGRDSKREQCRKW